jgi:hypothetical protein
MPYIVPTPPKKAHVVTAGGGELERELEALFVALMQAGVFTKIA